MLSDLLHWLDASPAHYWTVAWSAFGCLTVLACAHFYSSRERAWWRHPAIFAGLLLVTLFAFRWPVIFDNRPYPDEDESQLIAGASKLQQDPIFWRSVDGSTHGPLDEWPLLPVLLVRGSLDFTGARTITTLLAWVEVLSAWLIFRHLYRTKMAGLLVLPLLAFHSFTHAWSFVAHGSEHMPDALLALACYSLLMAWQPSGEGPPNLSRLFAAGVLIGALPFAKLQAAPMAATLFTGGIWFVLVNDLSSPRQRVRAVGVFAGGTALLPTIILVFVLIFGIWSDFLYSYILDNVRIGGGGAMPDPTRSAGQLSVSFAGGREFTWAEMPRMVFELGGSVFGFNEFFLWLLGFGLCGSLLIPWFTAWHRRCIGLGAVIVLVAILAAMAPGRTFIHYLQLAIFPAGLFGGLVAGALFYDLPHERFAVSGVTTRVVVIIAFVFCCLAPQLFWRIREPQPFLGRFSKTNGALIQSEASQEILLHTRAGETLGIWGWSPRFWVETGLIQATRDGNNSRQTDPYRYRDYFRARFMDDLVKSNPPVFIDAVGPGNFVYIYRDKRGHETFPELRQYLETNYYLARDVEGSRIYVRNDR